MREHTSPSLPWTVWAATVLSWLGLLVCLLLIQESLPGGLRICSSGSDCQAVISSRFSSMFGVPLSWLGATFYAGLLVLSLSVLGVASMRWRKRVVEVAVFASVVGVTFSVGLMYLQFFVLHSFCPLCTASAGIQVLLLAVLSLTAKADLELLPGSPGAAIALLAFAIAGSLGVSWPMLAAGQDAVAQVGNRRWSRAQMDRDLRAQTWPLKQQALDLETAWVRKKMDEELVALEAKKRGLTTDALVAQFGPDRSEQIAKLEREYAAKNLLSSVPRGPMAFQYDATQAIGPANAAVEIVIFSDFTCQFCIELDGVMRRIRNEFPQIRIAYRDFPLSADGPGFMAAVAGRCAAEQGRFSEYHDRLFDEKGDLPPAKLTAMAQQLHLDEERFAQCMRSEDTKNSVRASSADAMKLGIVGAPAIFVDGIMVGGMVDYVTLRKRILAGLDAGNVELWKRGSEFR